MRRGFHSAGIWLVGFVMGCSKSPVRNNKHVSWNNRVFFNQYLYYRHLYCNDVEKTGSWANGLGCHRIIRWRNDGKCRVLPTFPITTLQFMFLTLSRKTLPAALEVLPLWTMPPGVTLQPWRQNGELNGAGKGPPTGPPKSTTNSGTHNNIHTQTEN